MRLAAIDLGTVTARMLIADVDVGEAGGTGNREIGDKGGGETRRGHYGRIRELERHIKITHLGEGLYETGAIEGSAIAREVAVCRDFNAAIAAIERRDGHSVEVVLAVATSAMRDARNSDEVLDALRDVGIDVEVIAGTREAELSFRGALSGFVDDDAFAGQAVLSVDVGGGSTELILGTVDDAAKSDAGRPHVLSGHSFNVGSRRVTDRFLNSDPPTPEELARARAWVHAEMACCLKNLEIPPQILIAVAGTATTTVSVRDAMADYDPWQVHGSRVTRDELNEVAQELAKLSIDQRRSRIGLEPERASVIAGGLTVLQAVLELTGLDFFVASETDILQGILLDAVDAQKTSPPPD
jgi:exopolyphosphatase/guanosine-5'-triphosphate,3'-diphosphate pyrophosphatase